MGEIKKAGNDDNNVVQTDTRLHDILGYLVQDQYDARDRSDLEIFILQEDSLIGREKSLDSR